MLPKQISLDGHALALLCCCINHRPETPFSKTSRLNLLVSIFHCWSSLIRPRLGSQGRPPSSPPPPKHRALSMAHSRRVDTLPFFVRNHSSCFHIPSSEDRFFVYQNTCLVCTIQFQSMSGLQPSWSLGVPFPRQPSEWHLDNTRRLCKASKFLGTICLLVVDSRPLSFQYANQECIISKCRNQSLAEHGRFGAMQPIFQSLL